MRRFVTIVLSLSAASAFAQTNPITNIVQFGIRETPTNTSDQIVIGPSSCGTQRALFWIWNQVTPQACDNLRIWATSGGECGAEPKSGDKEYDSIPFIQLTTLRSGQFTITINELPGFAAGTSTPCGSATANVTHRICASVRTAIQCNGFQAATAQVASPALRLVYDVEPPNAPVISSLTAQDKALKVGYSVSSDTTELVPLVRAQGETEFRRRSAEAVSSGKELIIDSLLNGTTYEVVLRARDGAGNESVDSELNAGTPIRTIGFWGAFRDAGGTETGGCSLAPGQALGLLALTFWISRRRFR